MTPVYRITGKITFAIGIVFVTVLAMALGSLVVNLTWNAFSHAHNEYSLRELTRTAAADLENKVPIKIDNETIITSVKSDGTGIIYSYKISDDASAIDIAATKSAVTESALSIACRSPAAIDVLRRGGFYKYIYFDRTGTYLTDVTIERDAIDRCK